MLGSIRWLILIFWVVSGCPGLLAADPAPEALKTGKVSVGGFSVHYRSGGTGPPLLLLHGFTMTGAQWDPFVADFASRFRVIIPELPGHGQSTALPGAFSFKQSAQIMFGLLNKLDVERFHGIGHSAGAITLLHMAAQQPLRVESMVLVAGGHRMSPQGRQQLQEERFDTLDPTAQAYYLQIHPGGRKQIDQIFNQLRGLAENHADFAFSPEYLGTLTTRTLLVWGDRDPVFPVEYGVEMYTAMPHASLWVMPGQGHTPLWNASGQASETAANFTALSERFLLGGTTPP